MDNASPTEPDLIRRSVAGDGAAFERLFLLHGEALFRIACAVLASPDDAEDALQDVMLKVHACLSRFDHRRPISPWLRRIMVNECITRLRRRREMGEVHDDLPGTGDCPREAAEAAECARRVRRALTHLPPRQRVAITLFGLDDMDLRETARAMGCSAGAVKTHLHRARRKLADELSDLLSPQE